jgi:hypothetical protein
MLICVYLPFLELFVSKARLYESLASQFRILRYKLINQPNSGLNIRDIPGKSYCEVFVDHHDFLAKPDTV